MDDASATFAASFDDPRITPQFCRRFAGDGRALTLLGVVHDHPASVARVEAVIDRLGPDVLALELPSAAVPLYRAYANEAHPGETPRFGGEMSAAIAAAPQAAVVGIDAPNWSFVRRLAVRLVADRVQPSTARRVVASLGRATREVLTSRIAATVTNATSRTVAADDPIEYACSATDPPSRQADHERSHVAAVQALLGDTQGEALAYRDETREACMVDRLAHCRRRGEVVAVVGVDHLETLAHELAVDESSAQRPDDTGA